MKSLSKQVLDVTAITQISPKKPIWFLVKMNNDMKREPIFVQDVLEEGKDPSLELWNPVLATQGSLQSSNTKPQGKEIRTEELPLEVPGGYLSDEGVGSNPLRDKRPVKPVLSISFIIRLYLRVYSWESRLRPMPRRSICGRFRLQISNLW